MSHTIRPADVCLLSILNCVSYFSTLFRSYATTFWKMNVDFLSIEQICYQLIEHIFYPYNRFSIDKIDFQPIDRTDLLSTNRTDFLLIEQIWFWSIKQIEQICFTSEVWNGWSLKKIHFQESNSNCQLLFQHIYIIWCILSFDLNVCAQFKLHTCFNFVQTEIRSLLVIKLSTSLQQIVITTIAMHCLLISVTVLPLSVYLVP